MAGRRAGPGADAERGRLQVQLRGLLGAAAPLLLLFGCVALVAAAAVFYFRHQPNRHRRWRIVLFVMRAAVLCQVLLLLAEPILTLTIQSRKRPALWLLFDGTDSMNIADDLPPDVRAATDKAVGIGDAESRVPAPLPTRGRHIGAASRIEYLRALVAEEGPEPAGAAGQAVSPAGVPVRIDAGRPLAGTRGTRYPGRGLGRSTASTSPSNFRPTAK